VDLNIIHNSQGSYYIGSKEKAVGGGDVTRTNPMEIKNKRWKRSGGGEGESC